MKEILQNADLMKHDEQKKSPARLLSAITSEMPLFLAMLIIHLIVMIKEMAPYFSTDEIGVVASAAFFSGYDWSGVFNKIQSYYGFGQALFYLLPVRLIDDPVLLYRVMLFICSVTASLIPVVAYRIASSCLPYGNKWTKMIIAFAAGAYPTYLIYAKWVWYESLLGLIQWLIIALLVRCAAKRGNREALLTSISLGLLLAFSIAVHNRAIGNVAAVVISILLLRTRFGIRTVHFPGLIAAFLPAFVAVTGVKEYLLKHLWQSASSEVNNTLTKNAISFFSGMNGDMIWSMLTGLFGHLFYAIYSSGGIAILTFSIFVVLVFMPRLIESDVVIAENVHVEVCATDAIRSRDSAGYRNLIITLVFGVSIFLVSVLISVAFLREGILDGRGDYFIYGRYFSSTIGILIFAAIIWRYSSCRLSHALVVLPALMSIFLAVGFLLLLSPRVNERLSIADTPIILLAPFFQYNAVGEIERVNFFGCVAILSAFILVITILIIRKSRLLLGLIVATSILLYAYVSQSIILPASTDSYQQVKVMAEFVAEVGMVDSEWPVVYYADTENRKPWAETKLQYAIKQTPMVLLEDVSLFERRHYVEDCLILSTKDYHLEATDPRIIRVLNTSLEADGVFAWAFGAKMERILIRQGVDYTRAINLVQQSNPGIALLDASGIHTTGEEGFTCYGQHISLLPGTYRIEMEINDNSLKAVFDYGYVDVVSDGGKREHARVEINRDGFHDSAFTAMMTINLQEAVDEMEVRMYARIGTLLDISNIRIMNEE